MNMKNIATVIVSMMMSITALAGTGSIGSAGDGGLTVANVKGVYRLSAKDIYLKAELTLNGNGQASMLFRDGEGSGTCKGSYLIGQGILKTEFKNCLNTNLSHSIALSEVNFEELSKGTSVMVVLDMNGDKSPPIPFTILKVK